MLREALQTKEKVYYDEIWVYPKKERKKNVNYVGINKRLTLFPSFSVMMTDNCLKQN